jgi:diguanylate cyclase
MLISNISPPDSEMILSRAFDKFYHALISDPFLKEFLKDIDLEHLKRIQLTNFLESISEDEEAFFSRYKRLGTLHQKLGLPYVEYQEAFGKLYTFLIEEISTHKQAKDLRDAIKTYIDSAKNASAAGYLEPILENDKKTLKRQISQQIDIEAVKEHFRWILLVIEDIQNFNANPTLELDSHKCKYGKWLMSGEPAKYISDPLVIKTIKETHNDIHRITRNIYHSISMKDYRKIFINYVFLVRQSMYLYTELNINVTQYTLIEDVSKDPLTGLLNRHYLDEVLKSELHLHVLTGGVFSIVMFDLDHFKTINDTCGHQAGDEVIVTFADHLKKSVRKTDNVFRYGGEEFLAILPGTKREEAYNLAEKIRKAFERQKWEGCLNSMTITVSIGITEFSKKDKNNPHRVIFEADRNLYRAKELGRNRTVY